MDDQTLTRRRILETLGTVGAGAALGCGAARTSEPDDPGRAGAAPARPAPSPAAAVFPANSAPEATVNQRVLGRTGRSVGAVSLGGEGVLRTRGRSAEATAVIREALARGAAYCDTAPAYASSQDYYGEVFRADPTARARVCLASKTHDRTRDGSLRLLDESLRRLGTDHLDVWQLHDLRTEADLRAIFAPTGAIRAAEAARADGRVRFVGITGHHDPAILVRAMGMFDFDTVLAALNPADPARLPFATTVVPEARRRAMGVIGMKAFAAGQILADGSATVAECLRYVASLADTVIVGCSSPEEVRENLAIGASLVPMSADERSALEARLRPRAARYAYFKRDDA